MSEHVKTLPPNHVKIADDGRTYAIDPARVWYVWIPYSEVWFVQAPSEIPDGVVSKLFGVDRARLLVGDAPAVMMFEDRDSGESGMYGDVSAFYIVYAIAAVYNRLYPERLWWAENLPDLPDFSQVGVIDP